VMCCDRVPAGYCGGASTKHNVRLIRETSCGICSSYVGYSERSRRRGLGVQGL